MENNVENNRTSKFELLRIFAMLMIVACHYANHGIRQRFFPDLSSIWLNGMPINKLFTSFLINGGGIGNGIFFMLTGYFMFEKEYKIRRLVKLFAQVFFYALFVLIVWGIVRILRIYNFPELKPISQMMFFINAIIPITSGAWWFIQTYVIMFLFIPVLNNFLEKLNSRGFIFVFLFLWIFWLAPKVFGFGYANFQMAIFYYTLGAVLKKTDFSINKWLSLILFSIFWILLSIIDMKTSSIMKSDNVKEMLIKLIYSGIYNAVLTPLAVIAMFEFCKGLNIGNNKFINVVASTTFGIYLIHDSGVGRPLIWNKIFHCLDYQYSSNNFPIYAIATIIIVFTSCSIIDYLRQIILEKKVISFLNKKIDKLVVNIEKS